MAKNEPKQLNQTYERLVELLDNVNDAISVTNTEGNITGNEGKYWTTGQKNGKDIILVQKLSDDEEYVSLQNEIKLAQEDVLEMQDSVKNNSDDLKTLDDRVKVLEENMDMISSRITITRITAPTISTRYSEPDLIEYSVLSEDSSGAQTGALTVTWRRGGVNGLLLKTESIQQGKNQFDLTGYLNEGSNTITATFVDSYGTSKSINWQVNAVDIVIESDFDDTITYEGDAIISYVAKGSVEKTVHFELNGIEVYSIDISANNTNTQSYKIPHKAHGTYALTIYMTATIGTTSVPSNKLYFDIMFIDPNRTETLIRWPYDKSVALEQYQPTTFEYSVYTPNQTTSDIQLLEDGVVLSNRTVDSTEQKWTYKPQEYGVKELTIQCIKEGEVVASKTKTITINKFPYDIVPVTGNLELDFNPTGRTNSDVDYQSFEYTGISNITTKMSVSEGFDWNNGGWKVDADGNTYFCIKAGDRMTLSYPLFKDGKDAKGYGKNIKMVYKATSCRDFKAPVMECLETKGTSHVVKTTITNYNLENPTIETTQEEATYKKVEEIKEDQTTYTYYVNINDETDKKEVLDETVTMRDSWGHISKIITRNSEEQVVEGETLYHVISTIQSYTYETTIETSSKTYVDGVNVEDSEDIRTDLKAGTVITTEDDDDGNIITVTEVVTTEDNSYIGVKVQAQDATLYCRTGKIEAAYCEDKIMALEFNIESQGDLKNTMMAYVDADPIKVELYDAGTASFTHTSVKPIVFGSDKCDVHLYRFKVYSTMLSDDDIISNYIADAPSATEMVERFERNDILNNQTGVLDYEKLSRLYPELRIILITCPRFTYDKDDKVEGCTVQQIMGNQDPKHNWTATNVRIKGQGTSSNEYGTSGRNIDLKFNKYTKEDLFETDSEGNPIQDTNEDGTPKVDENGNPVYKLKEIAFEYIDGSTGSKYAMTENSIGVNYINVKVNIASSENANNSRLAQRFHQYNPYKRQARINNSKVRDTMEFHPCAIFIKELGYKYDDNGDKVSELTQEFPASETEFSFYACGDFGNSKKNYEALGMDENNLKECIVEISNNTYPVCKFQRPEGWDDILPVGFNTETNQLTDYVDYWDGDAIEFRYPEDLYAAAVNEDGKWKKDEIADARARLAELQPAVQRLWRWVESTDITLVDKENPAELLEPVNYGSVTYTHDTVEYREAKFINEYQNYFIKDSLLFHYLFTDRYLMIDNRAKNVFIHTTDGLHWDFCFNYDDDTSLGCDNRGDLKFDYYYEDIDSIDGTNVYNAQDSVLWVNVRKLLWKELCSVYNTVKDCWSATSLVNDFNEYQGLKPERLQMIDMRRKYLRPYKEGHYRTNLKEDPTGKTIVSQGQYLTMLNGRKALQRERFEKYRSVYCDSKYQSTALKEDLMTFRANSPDYADPSKPDHITVTWGDYFDITPYCDMYVYLDFDTNLTDAVRAKAGLPTRIYKPQGKLEDKNTRIYGASMISDIGDLAPFFIESPDFAKGVRLSTLKIGDESLDYKASSELKKLTLGSNTLLQTIDLRGCQDLEISLDLKGCTGLKELYTERSGITGVTFAESGLVETAKLNGITSLKAHKLKSLTDFSLQNYLQLSSINIDNTPLLLTQDFIDRCRNLESIRLIGIDWTLQNADSMEKFLSMSGITANDITIEKSVLEGKLTVNTIKESQLKSFNEQWPNLDIEYTNLIPTYKVTFYKDKLNDGTLVPFEPHLEYFYDEGQSPIDPIQAGIITTPIKESTPEYEYTFKGWDKDLDIRLYNDLEVIAQYQEKDRTYNVVWKNTSNKKTYLSTLTTYFVKENCSYGTDVVFKQDACDKYITENKGIKIEPFDQSFNTETQEINKWQDAYRPNQIWYYNSTNEENKGWKIDFMRKNSTKPFYQATHFSFVDNKGKVIEWKDKDGNIITKIPMPEAEWLAPSFTYYSYNTSIPYTIYCSGTGQNSDDNWDDFCGCTIYWSDENNPVPFTLTMYWERNSITESIEHRNVFNPEYNEEKDRYYLWKGWDKHSSYITSDLEINSEWEEDRLPRSINPDTIDTVDWSATTWYALVQKYSTAEIEDLVPRGNRAEIKFDLPNYKNALEYEDLISEPLILKKSEVKLEKEVILSNEDWSLLIDYDMLEGTALSALNKNLNGLRVESYSRSVVWDGTTIYPNLTGASLTTSESCREILVISHKKDSTNIEVTWGCPWWKNSYSTTISGQNLPNYSIILGGQREQGSSQINWNGSGTIYKCRLYHNYFGKSIRQALTNSVVHTLRFDLTSYGAYSDEISGQSKIDFVCSGTLSEPLYINSRSANLFVFQTDLHNWMNERFYSTIPSPWKTLIRKAWANYSNTLGSGATTNTSSATSYFRLPSINEVRTASSPLPLFASEYQGGSVYSSINIASSSKGFCSQKYLGGYQITPDIIGEFEDYPIYDRTETEPETPQNGGIYYYNSKYHLYQGNEWKDSVNYWVRGRNTNAVSSVDYYSCATSSGSLGSSMSYSNRIGVVPCFSIGLEL